MAHPNSKLNKKNLNLHAIGRIVLPEKKQGLLGVKKILTDVTLTVFKQRSRVFGKIPEIAGIFIL